MAVALAVETGIHWNDWLDDERAMVTAMQIFQDRAAAMKRR